MKFNKILHPEIVLGKRGGNHLYDQYKLLHSVITREENGYATNITEPTGRTIAEANDAFQSHVFITHKFKEELPRCYYIPKDFTLALSKVDPTIPSSCYPERFFGYIAFASDALPDDDGSFAAGAYVFIGKGKETSTRPENFESPYFWISIVFTDSKNNFTGQAGHMTSRIEDGQISDFLEKQKTVKNADPINKNILRTIINATLYINSVDASLLNLPVTPKHLSQTQQKKFAQKTNGIVNECTIPVTLVSWDYKKPKQYAVSETFVETHMRWQRCGKDLNDLKLIWVKPHMRRYDNVHDSSTGPGNSE